MKNRTHRPAQSVRRRRRGSARLFVLGAAFLATTASAARAEQLGQAPATQLQQTSAATARYLIQPASIDVAIVEFSRLSGLTITLDDPGLGMIQSPGLDGAFTVNEALQRLLMGTGVGFRFTGASTVALSVASLAEQVEVSGRAPVVESPKYVAPLREIPQTIAVVTRDVIEAQGATTLSEALRNVPGITLQAGEGGGASNTAGDMFNLRGFNAANSMFVDGVRDDGLISRDVFNLEQVEVFMGPTSSDVGRTTAGGYVNMQTKTPHVGSSYGALLSVGTADQRRVSTDINLAAASGGDGSWLGKAAFRLNLLWQDSGVPGRDEVVLETKAVAPSLAFGLDTRTRLTIAGQFVRQDNLPDYGIPGAAWLNEPLAPTTVRASAPVDSTNYYGSVGYDHDRATQNGVTARLEHDVNRNVTVRNQTRVSKATRDAIISTIQNPAAFNAATNQVTIARQGNYRENRIVSNQTSMVDRFTTGTLRHAASLGFELTAEEQFAPAVTGLGTRAPVDIFNPNPRDLVTGFAPVRSGALTDGSTDTIAFYAFDTVDFGARWQATGGLRWERYSTDFLSVDAAGVTTADLEASDSLLSGKVGLLYKVNPTANVYLSYGTGVTPPGTANFTLSAQPNNVNSPNVEPQRSTNYEVGSKWDLASGRMSFNAALFRTDNENVIFTVDATAVPPIYNQDDAQRVTGFTVGAMGRPVEAWQIFANVGYLDSELRTQNSANNGMRLTLTPEWSGSLWTTYRTPIRLTVGGGVRFTDAVFINAANTIKSPGYSLVDGLVEYEVNSHLSLRLNLYNVTDETYVRNVNNNGGRYNPGQPRSVLLTSNVRF